MTPRVLTSSPFRVLLVGSFRSVVPEGWDSPLGSQGGFVDALAPEPYSLANGYLAAFANSDEEIRENCHIELLDLAEPLFIEDEREHVRFTEEDLLRILATEPDLVAFSTYCWNLQAVLDAASQLSVRRPGLRIVLGGRGVDGETERILVDNPGVDCAILGEGEPAFLEVLRRRGGHLDGIPGVVSRNGDEVSAGGPPRCLTDLDRIPSPYLTGVLQPPRNGVMLELSRGCLHRCGYCTWNADKELRFFGVERIEAEVRWALDQGHRLITLNDSAINYDTQRLREFVEAIGRADPEGRIHFTYNVRHELLDDLQLEALSRIPTHMVLLGVETLSSGPMAEVSREAVDRQNLFRRLGALAQATRPPVASIVLGLPGDDEESFRETLETLLERTRPRSPGTQPTIGAVLVSLLQVYRGSGLWARREELGLRFKEPGIPYLLESPSWPREALARTKRYLVRLMSENRENLKAAEAIVLMEALREVDPWLSKVRIGRLLEDWPLGTTHEGWTLTRMGLMRDTGDGFSLRFRWRESGEARVLLRRRGAGVRVEEESRLFSLDVRGLPGCEAPAGDIRSLGRQVREMLLAGEAAAAAAMKKRHSARTP